MRKAELEKREQAQRVELAMLREQVEVLKGVEANYERHLGELNGELQETVNKLSDAEQEAAFQKSDKEDQQRVNDIYEDTCRALGAVMRLADEAIANVSGFFLHDKGHSYGRGD